MGQAHGSVRRKSSLANLRTAVTARVRSKPPSEGQVYLDLYALKRDRARWNNTKERAEQSIQSIDKALQKVESALADLEDETPSASPLPGTIDFKNCPKQKART